MKFWVIILCLLFGMYGALTAYAGLFSDSLLYHPNMGSYREPRGMLRLPDGRGGTVAALFLPNPQARHVIWFFHGNAEDLGDIEPFLREIHDRGFAVFAVEYPGYGYSTGRPSEAAIYAATQVGWNYLRQEKGIKSDQIIAFGRSLGGGPAVELASREPLAGLILQSAFASAFRVVTHWRILPFDKFNNLGKMPRVTCPVLVMHGGEDRVVPFNHGERLYAAAPGPKQKLWISIAGHNDFVRIAGPKLWWAISEFERSFASTSS